MLKHIWIAAIPVFVLYTNSDAHAQLFPGKRTFGQSITRQQTAGGGSFGPASPAPGIAAGAKPGEQSTAGATTEGLRQQRAARNAAENDPNRILDRPAALDVVEEIIPENLVNPARTPLVKNRMYEPRLSVAFPYAGPSSAEINAHVSRQMVNLSQQRDPLARVTLTVVGQTARLQGTVSSPEERSLIENLVLFEPGISAVQNDLRVLSAAP